MKCSRHACFAVEYWCAVIIELCIDQHRAVMTLSELQKQALRLSPEERWQLVNRLMLSLQPKTLPSFNWDDKSDDPVQSLIGIAKTDEPAPTDAEVRAMLDERLVEKYL